MNYSFLKVEKGQTSALRLCETSVTSFFPLLKSVKDKRILDTILYLCESATLTMTNPESMFISVVFFYYIILTLG